MLLYHGRGTEEIGAVLLVPHLIAAPQIMCPTGFMERFLSSLASLFAILMSIRLYADVEIKVSELMIRRLWDPG